MPAEGLLPRLRELGRLRAGEVREITTKGKKTTTVPAKLEHWRMTSPFRNLIEAAAKLYGGEVEEWAGAPTEHAQWQVTTETADLEVLVPPQDVDVMYELWSGGGRSRLCDGHVEQISDEPCMCDPAQRSCKPRTQLVVLLPSLPDLGHWRLVTQSVFAAMEIPATMQLLRQVHERAIFAHATLSLEQRTTKTDGTKHFAVPVLRLDYSLAEAGLLPTKAANLETGEIVSPALPVGEQPGSEVADQATRKGEGGTAAPKPSDPGGTSDSGDSTEISKPPSTSESDITKTTNCRHLKGSKLVDRATGGRAEVCIECGIQIGLEVPA